MLNDGRMTQGLGNVSVIGTAGAPNRLERKLTQHRASLQERLTAGPGLICSEAVSNNSRCAAKPEAGQ